MTDYLILTAIASEFAAVKRPSRRPPSSCLYFPPVHRRPIFSCSRSDGTRFKDREANDRLGRESLDPKQVIVVGTAGALRPDFQLGDILIPVSVQSEQGVVHDVAPLRIEGIPFVPTQRERLSRASRLIESSEVVSSVEAKKELNRSSDADAVDMESFTVVDLCNALGRDASVVRFISDTLDHNLPPESSTLLNQQGNPRFVHIMGAILRRPMLFNELLQLQRDSRIANHAIQKWTIEFRETIEAVRR